MSDNFTPGIFEDVPLHADCAPKDNIHYKTKESIVGFIVYVNLTYTSLTPYLKGIYLTLNFWQNGRNEEGWLIPEAKRVFRLGALKPEGDLPKHVKILPRFYLDMIALVTLTSFESPLGIPIRSSHDKALYIVGNASGSGFGSSWWVQDGVAVDAQFGRWKFDVTENKSSNSRESANLVHSLKSHLKNENISPGTEFFICTNNAVAESTYFKGSSKSPKMHKIIVEI